MTLVPNPLIIPIGLIIGILVAAPVGPVNVVCIQRAVERGFWGGVAAGLGAVLGDGLIALCAALGVSAISGAIQHYGLALQVIGGIALLVFGARLYRTSPRLDVGAPGADVGLSVWSYAGDIPKTFFLTITNPAAVLGLFAIFGGVSTFVAVRGAIDALTMVAAIMAGSLVWWIGLSHLVGRIRHRLTSRMLLRINRIAGLLLVGFGGVLVAEAATLLAARAA